MPDQTKTLLLLERAKAGDREAVEQLCARYGPRLRRWATGRLPSWARSVTETQDLVQETLFQTFRKIGDFQPENEGALQAYLRTVLLNRLRDELRRVRRRPNAGPLDSQHVDPAPSPLEAAIGRQGVDRYEAALARLTPGEREALIGRLELGFTYDELAAALDKPSADAARKTAQRALARLLEEMESEA